MSDADEKISSLEREYNSLFEKESRERRHKRYLNIGSIIGIIFIFVSTPYEKEFYTLIDKWANKEILHKVNGEWTLKIDID